MCGISGYIDLKRQTRPGELLKVTQTIRHRGPDGEGYVFLNSNEFKTCYGPDTNEEIRNYSSPYQPKEDVGELEATFSLGLGHRRLSILDLSPRGHMPMCDESQQYWMTYNGEVYNFTEIRKKLEQVGYQFKTEGDSEVVLKAFMHWGPDCLNKFIGMFAIAIYHLESQKLFLARDRFGIKPLYYYTSKAGVFYFGSEIKQFTQTSSWEASLNVQKAYDYLFYSLTDHTQETMFNGVFQLPPATYFYANLAHFPFIKSEPVCFTKWYSIKPQKTAQTYESATKKFADLFENAVALHLRADVNVGSALSGGIDSSSIVCQINKLLEKQGKTHLQKTFSSVSNVEQFSEKNWMNEVTNLIKVDSHFVYPKPERLQSLTSELIWFMDEPYQSQSAFLGFHVFESAQKNKVKVLLNGQGADEYLSGYSEYTKLRHTQMLLRFQFKSLKKELSEEGLSGMVFFKYVAELLLSRILPNGVKHFLSSRKSEFRDISGIVDFKETAKNFTFKHPLHTIANKGLTPLAIAKVQIYTTSLPKYLRWEDRNSMANGVEARVPFLDHRLVEYCLAQPLNYLNRAKATPKPFLSDSMKAILPESIASRKDKKGFITPEEFWVKSEYSSQIREMLKESINCTKGIIKPEALGYFDKMVAGKKSFSYTYWRLISFGIWMKRFDVKIK